MSTRATVYHEEDGVHIFQDFMDEQDGHTTRLRLEFMEGPFAVSLLLSEDFSAIIMRGLKRHEES